MRGMEILTFLRDALQAEAHDKRTFIEDCERVAGGSTDPALRQRVAALEAAADAFDYIIAIGQDEARRCKSDARRIFPEWITRITTQARATLVQPAKEKENAG